MNFNGAGLDDQPRLSFSHKKIRGSQEPRILFSQCWRESDAVELATLLHHAAAQLATRGFFLTLTRNGGLFVEFTAPNFGRDSCLLALFLETLECTINRLAFFE